MQSAEHHVRATISVVVGEVIRTIGRRDVDLNHDEIGCIVQVERFDVLVLKLAKSS